MTTVQKKTLIICLIPEFQADGWLPMESQLQNPSFWMNPETLTHAIDDFITFLSNTSAPPLIICLIQDFEAVFLWKVSLKIMNSGRTMKSFKCTHPCTGRIWQCFLQYKYSSLSICLIQDFWIQEESWKLSPIHKDDFSALFAALMLHLQLSVWFRILSWTFYWQSTSKFWIQE